MSKGTGVCAFKTAEEATTAIAAVNGTELKGSTLEVDVWTKGVKTDKDGPADDAKTPLVKKIKELQRSSADTKKKWWTFCDEKHGGVHDPKKLDQSVLEEFLKDYP